MVHADDIDWDCVLRRGGDDDLLATSLDVQLSLRFLCENTGGLTNVGGTAGSPRDARRVLLVKDLYLDTVHDQVLLPVSRLGGNGAREALVHAVVLELVEHVLEVHEGVVDALDGDFRVGHRSAEHQATNAAEAIDAHGSRHDAGSVGRPGLYKK